MISIIILSHNRLDLTRQCLESVRAHTAEPHEVIVVDNGSTDGTQEFLLARPEIRAILNPENAGFPAGCNQGIAAARGEWLLLLNNDMLAVPRWLTNLLACHQATGGLVGPCCNHISGMQRIDVPYTDTEESLRAFAEEFTRPDPRRWRRVARLGGGGLLLPRQVLDRIGNLDERFTPGNYEDDDLSLRALVAGIPLYIAGDSFVHHYGDNVFRAPDPAYARLLSLNGDHFCRKWEIPDPGVLYVDTRLAALVPPEARRILDCSCGAGALGLLLKERDGVEVVGLEAQPALAAAATHLLDRVIAGPQTEADLPAESFDAVVMPDLLEHLADPWGFLHRAAGLLRPGGMAVVSAGNAVYLHRLVGLLTGRPPYRTEEPWVRRNLRAFSLPGLQTAVETAGLQVQTVLGTVRELSEAGRQLTRGLEQLLPAAGEGAPPLEAQLCTEQFLIAAQKGGGD